MAGRRGKVDNSHWGEAESETGPARANGQGPMRLLPAIVIAVAILLASLIWVFVPMILGGPANNFDGAAVDSQARIDLEMMRQQVEVLQEAVSQLQSQVASMDTGAVVAPPPGQEDQTRPHDGPNAILNAYANVVLIANRTHFNDGLTVATPAFLTQMFGKPREDLSDQCESMENPTLKAMLEVAQVGPVKVQMLHPALVSLGEILEKVRKTDPDLYDRINTSGSLCVRRIRGTQDALSTHAFGLAVDLNIDGHLDNFADGKTQLGLTILADFFKQAGWVWGAGFGREDSMHFEASQELIMQWRAEGKI